MATVNKDFRVKHGLVVEGSTATVNGSNVLTEASTEFLQDTIGAMVDGSTQTNISVTYDDATGKLNFVAENGVADSTTDNLAEGSTRLYFTDERAQDAAQSLLTHAGHNGIEFTYDDQNNKLTATVTGAAVPTFTSGIIFEGSTPNEFETTFAITDPTADRTITFPDLSGTVVTTGDTGSVTNTMLAGSISNDKLSNSSVTINGYTINLGGSATYSTDNVNEGTTNKYFTDERAQDAIAIAIANGTQTNISVTYDDLNNALNFNATGGVASLSGTANEVEVTNVGTAYTVGLPNDVTIAGHLTIATAPTQSTHAANKAYVDSVTEGLHIHASAVAATTTNISISNDLEAGDVLDGVTLVAGNRVLVKNQNTASENGIYVVQASGAAIRAADFDQPAEVDGGDFIFVTGGTVNDNTGWVQTSDGVVTIGTDPIIFTQFSGAGTYLAGNGLVLNGNTFAIDTLVTTDLNSVQTLTNKTLTSPTITTPTVSGLYLSDNNIVVEGTNNTHETTLTFTDPTDDRTITFKDESGTVAFTSDIESAVDAFGNAVVSGTGISASYNATSNALTITNTDLGSSQNIFKNVVVGATTVTADSNNDTLTITAGTGITLTANATTDTVDIANAGVTSLAGTTDQISVSGSTGAVTLSLPQNIATTSSPTFGSLTVNGNVTLSDALIGTATLALTDSNETVVDAWSPAAYSSAKYIVQMKKGSDIEVIEVLVTVDGNNNVYITEYADVISNVQLGTTNADYSGGAVRLLVTASNATTVKVHKTLIEA